MTSFTNIQKNKNELKNKMREFYNTEVRSVLSEYEKQRKFILKHRILIILSLIYILIVHCTSLSIILPVLGYIVLFLGGYIINFLSKDCDKVDNPDIAFLKDEANCKLKLKKKLMPKFMEIFGNLKWVQGSHVNSKEVMKCLGKLKIFPHYFTINFDDMIKGSIGNIKLELFEIKTGCYSDIWQNFPVLFYSSFSTIVIYCVIVLLFNAILSTGVKSLIIIFGIIFGIILVILPLYLLIQMVVTQSTRGVMIRCILPKTFKSHTFVYENSASSAKLFFKYQNGYEKVNLEDVEFNKMYQVLSKDQIEARCFLSAAFMERFKNLKTAFNPQYQRIEVIGNEMFIFLKNKKDCFEMSSITEKTTYSHFITLFEEIYSVLSLVEQLKLNQKISV